MAAKFRPIDRVALAAYLPRHPHSPTGVILRLAWLAGLSREEICALAWECVDLSVPALNLPDRTVPLDEALLPCIEKRRELYGSRSPFVVLSDRSKTPLTPESVSRLARLAFAELGHPGWKLMDLRHDFILRQIEAAGWPWAARVSGMAAASLQTTFAGFVKSAAPKEEKHPLDEFALWKVMQSQRTTPAGLALWLTWQMGLSAREIVDLTWDQVSLEDGTVRLADRTVAITNAVGRILEGTRAARLPGDDAHVVLTAQTRSPLDLPRLSRLTRSALIRGGLEDVQLRQLRKNERREGEDAMLLRQVMESGCISRGTVCQLLGVSKTAAHARLNRLLEQKKLVRIGAKYYLPGTVVPPEEHSTVIREYLTREGFAYRKDIAQLLHIDSRQCTPILQRLVAEGELEQHQQKYYLHASSE